LDAELRIPGPAPIISTTAGHTRPGGGITVETNSGNTEASAFEAELVSRFLTEDRNLSA
jgi:hypothetical protein